MPKTVGSSQPSVYCSGNREANISTTLINNKMLAIRKDVFVFVINTFLGSLSVWVCPVVSHREMMNSKFSLNISLKLNILHHVYQKWNILLSLCHKLHGKKKEKKEKTWNSIHPQHFHDFCNIVRH